MICPFICYLEPRLLAGLMGTFGGQARCILTMEIAQKEKS